MQWPNRVWERQPDGRFSSRPVTAEDTRRRREFETAMGWRRE